MQQTQTDRRTQAQTRTPPKDTTQRMHTLKKPSNKKLRGKAEEQRQTQADSIADTKQEKHTQNKPEKNSQKTHRIQSLRHTQITKTDPRNKTPTQSKPRHTLVTKGPKTHPKTHPNNPSRNQ